VPIEPKPQLGRRIWQLLVGGATLVFSYMSGIIHPYHTIALAPAVGALTGIAAVVLWRIRDRMAARVTMTAMLAVTVTWAWVLLGRNPGWYPWLRVVVVLAALGAAGFILSGRAVGGHRAGDRGHAGLTPADRSRRFLAAAAVPLAVIAGLAGPLAYSISTDVTAHTGAIPLAGLAVADGFGGPGAPRAAGGAGGGRFPGRAGAPRFSGTPGGQPGAGRFPGGAGGRGFPGGGGFGGGFGRDTQVAATVGAESAAPLQLAGGDPIMAIGGFNGTDSAPTLAQFEKLVSEHKIHYFVGRARPASAAGPATRRRSPPGWRSTSPARPSQGSPSTT
jgi:hypothetical protein